MPDPDYKALCAELLDAYAYLIDRYMTAPSNKDALVYRARAALVAEPEPSNAMIPDQYKGHQVHVYRAGFHAGYEHGLTRATAALAQPDPISELVSQCRPLEPEMAEYLTPQARWRLYGDEAQPEPMAPTDEEIMELMPQQMRDDLANAARALAGFDRANVKAAGAMRIILNRQAVNHARAVLARWGTPANNTRGTH